MTRTCCNLFCYIKCLKYGSFCLIHFLDHNVFVSPKIVSGNDTWQKHFHFPISRSLTIVKKYWLSYTINFFCGCVRESKTNEVHDSEYSSFDVTRLKLQMIRQEFGTLYISKHFIIQHRISLGILCIKIKMMQQVSTTIRSAMQIATCRIISFCPRSVFNLNTTISRLSNLESKRIRRYKRI